MKGEINIDLIDIDIHTIQVETMTLRELTNLFRSLGIATSDAKLADGIEQGAYPFAVCIRQKDRQFEIYKRKVYEWISERATPAAVNNEADK